MENESASTDPILRLIDGDDRLEGGDDFLYHMMSLSDVVKNDMKATLAWSEDIINQRLQSLIRIGLDENFRYRIRPSEKDKLPAEKLSLRYVEAQCLLTEWLAIYRVIRTYVETLRKRRAA